jgi:hypothetical protein
MLYRGWTITVHQTYLGFSAQYISPMGLPRQTGGTFPTAHEAMDYAEVLVDHLLRSERLRSLADCAPALVS